MDPSRSIRRNNRYTGLHMAYCVAIYEQLKIWGNLAAYYFITLGLFDKLFKSHYWS